MPGAQDVLWFIVCVAVVNMATDFGLGILLAGTTADAGIAGARDDSYEDYDIAELNQQLLGESELSEPTESPSTAVEERGDKEEISEGAEPANDTNESVEASNDNVMADLDAAVSMALGDEELAESESAEDTPDQGETEQRRPEDPLKAYHLQLESFCEDLAAVDDRLRKRLPEETSDLKAELASVVESSQRQSEACAEVEESLRKMVDSEAIDEKHGEAIIAAIKEERQEATETIEAFEQLDSDSVSGEQCDEVLDRTARLLDANHDIRDHVSGMISETESSDDDDVTNGEVDPLTEIMSRSALDATLAEHWRKDPHRARAVSLAVIDLDYFGKFNRSHGPTVGNRVLRAIGQLLQSEAPPDYHVARYAGQQFALLAIDRDLKQGVSDVERVRQTIETLRLEYGDCDLEITVSCGVVAASQDDTQESLYARAIESVHEAKRYGRNRTFTHEGEYPTPVVPPNFALTEKHVTV